MKKIIAFFGVFLALFAFLCVPVFAASAFDFPVVLPENNEYYYVIEYPKSGNGSLWVSDIEGCEYVVYCSPEKLVPVHNNSIGRDQLMCVEDGKTSIFVYYFENLSDVKKWLVSNNSITPLYSGSYTQVYVHLDKLVFTNHGDGFKYGSTDFDVSDRFYNPGSIVDKENVAPLFSEIIGLLPILLPVLVGYLAIRKGLSFIIGVLCNG